MACPLDPQSLDGPEILAHAMYQRLPCNKIGSSNSIGYFCLGPHSYGISSVSAITSPSDSCSPPSTPISNNYKHFLNVTNKQFITYNYKLKVRKI